MTETIAMRARSLPPYPTSEVDHLPGEFGWPVFGQSIEFLNRAADLVERMQAEHGSVFRCNIMRSSLVVFGDPDSAELLLKDKDQNFSSRRGWAPAAALFDRGILLRDFEDHKPHRRALQNSFDSAAMNRYAAQLNALIADNVAQWETGREFKFGVRIKSVLLDNAASVFLGSDLGDESDRLNRAFVDLINGLLTMFRYRIPGSKWAKSQAGKAYLKAWLYARVEERMQSDATDFFSALCRGSRDPEHPMSIDEVVEHTLLLLFAAHDTTTGTLSSLMSLLCQHPEWQEKLRSEALNLGREDLGLEDLKNLPLFDLVFKEALRLHPPVFAIPRRSINAFEFAGHSVPANTAIHLNIHLIHRSANYWSRPEAFDPERFSAERSEHKRHRYQFIPFGAGAHTCLGNRFAEAQTKIFLFHFLRRFRAVPRAGRSAAMRVLPYPTPKDGLPISLEPLERSPRS